MQDPTPVERARTVTRMAGVLNHAPNDRALSQDLRNPQIREAGFRLSTSTDTASRPSARAPRGPSFLTELEKSIRTIPTYSVYGTIARLLRASPEGGLFLMAEARWQRVGSLPSVMAFVAQATHPAGALLRDRQPAA